MDSAHSAPTWQEIRSSNVAELTALLKERSVHPLVIEDCINRNQRPKLEEYENHHFLVWLMVHEGKVHELQFVILKNEVIFVPHDAPPSGASWYEFLKLSNHHKDEWHLVYQALDSATDVTNNGIRRVLDKIDSFEEKIFNADWDPKKLLKLKKELNHTGYNVEYLGSVAEQIRSFYGEKNDLNWKLRDLVDHCERMDRQITLYISQISSTIELYWGYQANRSNNQIKKLSVLASIALPMTFWTSFWGMNFETIPFHSRELFGSALLVMIGSVGMVLWLLIRRGYWKSE